MEDIWDYSLERWGEEQADSYLRQIALVCQGIANGSHPGSSAEAIQPGLRKALVNMHVLYYRETADSIVVARVLHQRMNVLDHVD